MGKRAEAVDDRQGVIPIDLPPGPRLSSDERACAEMRAMVDTLANAKEPPWSWRLLGWQRRRFAALSHLLTPIEAAALAAKFEEEIERLGPPQD